MKHLLAIALGIFLVFSAHANDILRIATMETGTVNWEIDTIKNLKLDEQNGFELDVTNSIGNSAKIAFTSHQVDSIVADLVWVISQNAMGHDYVFFPYSKNVGALLTKSDSGIRSISDLRGRKIGIAGGPLDKNWILLTAFAKTEENLDLLNETEQIFGAAPLIMQSALNGQTDATINFWHYQVKMEEAGMISLIEMHDIAVALGLDPDTPLLGYVFHRDYAESHPELIEGLINASKDAKEKIRNDDAVWNALRARVDPKSDQEFAALRVGFVSGTLSYDPVNIEGVNALLKILRDNGGAELVLEGAHAQEDMFIQ